MPIRSPGLGVSSLFTTSRLALACLLAASCPAVAFDSSLTVPIVISSAGAAGSFYTSELSLTNRGTTAATARFTYVAAYGGGGGVATTTIPRGQKTVSDAIQYLISIGLPIPSSGNRGGVLRVDFTGLSSPDAGAVTARTTTAVSGGRAGLSYPAFDAGLDGPAYLCGLRQDETDRANVAVLNAGAPGAGDIVLRLTAFSGDPGAPVSHVFPDLTLSPGAFNQYNQILKDAALVRGYVRVERVSGTAPYYAYATINDQKTSDGSFVPPLSEEAAYESNFLTLPVVVETTVFSTEVVLCNVSAAPRTVQLFYVADAIQTPDSTASVSITLAAREQRVIPAFVKYLRDQGIPGIGAPGGTVAGALTLTATGAETGGIFLGGRTQTSGGGGRYGLFYTALAHGTAATSGAWLYGLQQNAENRTNLALVNTGGSDSTTDGLHVDLYDGDSGSIARSFDVALAPRKWTQINTVLSPGIANGYAHISRTSGTNPFLAYVVVVDGGQQGARSDDGAFVSLQVEEPQPSAELLAIRRIEAKCVSLNPQGLSRLEFIRAVAATMATMPEYAVTGVDEGSLTAYGVFTNGRLHVVSDNREFDAIPPSLPPSDRIQALAGAELPGSGYARLLQSFGQTVLTQEPVSQLATVLEDPGGYVIRIGKVGDARLTALRNVKGDGFFYFNTHGARMWRTRDQSDAAVFCIQSSTLATPAADLQGEIAADLAAGRLTYFTAPPGTIDPITGRLWVTQYGITGDFVKSYWEFAPNSIVFLNICWSAYTRDPAGPREFIDACLSKNAGVYLGWNEKANSGTCFTAARYFVERLIGAKTFMKENPDQRAFPWELVYADMQSRGLTRDSTTGADLIAIPRPGGSSVILDPSIEYLIVDEARETLELKGYFGTTKGKVTVGARELTTCAWGADAIVCPLAATGAGSNGDVFVEVPGELSRMRKSNVRQLTEWDIPIHYLWTGMIEAEYKFEGTGKIRLRADVGSYRRKPGEPPFFPLLGMVPTKDSYVSVSASGSHRHVGQGYDYTVTLGGSAVFKPSSGGSPLLPLLIVLAKVDTKAPHAGALGLSLDGTPGSFKVTCTGSPCAGEEGDLPPTFGFLDGDDDFPSPLPDGPALTIPAIKLTWDTQFAIPLKKFVDPDFGGTGSVITVEWQQAVQPIPPVKFDGAR
jgi:hypothetical protein